MTQPSPSIEYFIQPNLYVEASVRIGNRLLILAESESGPLYEPILCYRSDMVSELFGEGRLSQLYTDASVLQENQEVYLMRIEEMNLSTAFSVLEGMSFDLMYVDGLHFDENFDLTLQALQFAETKQEMGNLIHIITTLSKPYSFSELLELSSSIHSLSTEEGDETIEGGKYLSIVAKQMKEKDAGIVYAGMLGATNPEVSPINKKIPGVSLELEFSNQEILELRALGIVCFKNTFKNGVVCTSSSCAVSTAGSVHKHISNFRIAQSLINQVSVELEPFIGRTNLQYQSMNIENVLLAICEEAVAEQRIRYYGYDLSVNEAGGYIDIEMELVPIFSVHGMKTYSRMRVFK